MTLYLNAARPMSLLDLVNLVQTGEPVVAPVTPPTGEPVAAPVSRSTGEPTAAPVGPVAPVVAGPDFTG